MTSQLKQEALACLPLIILEQIISALKQAQSFKILQWGEW